jgi:hypothetical protein
MLDVIIPLLILTVGTASNTTAYTCQFLVSVFVPCHTKNSCFEHDGGCFLRKNGRSFIGIDKKEGILSSSLKVPIILYNLSNIL